MSNGESKFGYAIVRDGKVVGVELTKACAMHWVEAEIIPLAPAKQRDELLSALEELNSVSARGFLYDDPARVRARAAIASVKGGA